MSAEELATFFDRLHEVRGRQDVTHGAHPYPAKFIPQIPQQLISTFSSPGDTVLDPMCGSGTTLVEANLMGRSALGVDVNPISTLISRVKTRPLTIEQLESVNAAANALERNSTPIEMTIPDFPNREHWFYPDVAQELASLLAYVDRLQDDAARDFWRCTFSAIVVSVSNQDSETRWSRVDRAIDRVEVRRRFLRHLREDMRRNVELAALTKATSTVVLGDARDIPFLSDSVDLVVTSPPYANSHDYYLYNKLRMYWLGYDVKATQKAEFGSRNKHSDQKQEISEYEAAMTSVLLECRRVMRSGKRLCLVVGDAVVRGQFFDMGTIIPGLGDKTGFALEGHLKFDQKRYTRAFTRGFGTSQPKSTHVVVLKNA